MDIPIPEIYKDHDYMLRVYALPDDSMVYGFSENMPWKDTPTAWGILIADIITYIVDALEQHHGLSKNQTSNTIFGVLDQAPAIKAYGTMLNSKGKIPKEIRQDSPREVLVVLTNDKKYTVLFSPTMKIPAMWGLILSTLIASVVQVEKRRDNIVSYEQIIQVAKDEWLNPTDVLKGGDRKENGEIELHDLNKPDAIGE